MRAIKRVSLLILIAFSITILFSNINAHAITTIIKVGYVPGMPPYQFEFNDSPAGAHIEIMDSIGKDNDFEMLYIPYQSAMDLATAFSNKDIDIAIGNVNTSEIKNYAVLSEVLSETNITMIASNDIAAEYSTNRSKSFLTAIEINTISYTMMHSMSNTKYIVTSTQEKAFDELVNGHVEALIGLRSSIMYQLDQLDLRDDYTIVNNYISSFSSYVAIRNDEKELLDKINTSIYKMRINGEYDELLDKWINDESYIRKNIFTKAIRIVLLVVLFFLLVILFYLRINRALKKQVEKQTEELVAINEELKDNQKKLIESNEITNKTILNSPSGIAVIDNEKRIRLINPMMQKILGSDAVIGEEATNYSLLSSILEEIPDSTDKEFVALGKELKTSKKKNEGRVYRYSVYGLSLTDEQNHGEIISIEDITEETKRRQEVVERDKSAVLNQIVSEMAHEILNPLTSIKTFVEIMPEKVNEPKFRDKMVKIVPNEIDRVNILIRRLLDYAKPSPSEKKCISLERTLESCLGLLDASISKYPIQVEFIKGEDPFIYADEGQIKQAFLNVLINAIDSIKEKLAVHGIEDNYIRITISRNKDIASVVIRDSGMGMDDETLNRAFELFFTTKNEGTGLGLAITKRFIEENGGEITIHSEHEEFTEFTFTFYCVEGGKNETNTDS